MEQSPYEVGLVGTGVALDRRTQAYDEAGRVAEVALLGQLDGSFSFIGPLQAWNGGGRFTLHARPDALSPQVSEVLPGEALETVLRRPDGWVWLRTLADGYLGYGYLAHGRAGWLLDTPPGQNTPPGQTWAVTALRGHVYAGPSIQSARLGEVGLGAIVWPLEPAGTVPGWRRVAWAGDGGYVAEVILSPLPDDGPADLALRLVGTPYVWGGRSGWGLDCSGLTQLVYGAFGQALPRDSDQQLAALTPVERPRRGDLAFFPGHVGLMLSAVQMVHANTAAMAVSVQTLGEGEDGDRLQTELLGFGRWDR